MINIYYCRETQGCVFIDDENVGMYEVYNADGDYICTTDFDGATRVCEEIEKSKS